VTVTGLPGPMFVLVKVMLAELITFGAGLPPALDSGFLAAAFLSISSALEAVTTTGGTSWLSWSQFSHLIDEMPSPTS